MRVAGRLRRVCSDGISPDGGIAWLLLAVLLLGTAGFAWHLAVPIAAAIRSGNLAFNDLFAQWSFARFAMRYPAAGLYDEPTLFAFQKTLFAAHRLHFPFPYPPPYLFAVWPLGWLDQWQAWALWSGGGLALFLAAALAGRWRGRDVALLLLAPLTVLTVAYGQNGVLTSALILGGLRLLGRRAVLAGVLLGLACIKPQLGVLVPVALLAARQWTTLAAAALTIAALILASAAAFGWAPWQEFLAGLVGHAANIDASVGDYRKPTLTATLLQFHLDRAWAYRIQGVVALAMAALVWRAFRRGVSELAVALLIVATFLATPYGFFYDMPMLTAAILMVAAGFAQRIPWPAAAVLAAALVFPIVTTLTSRFFWVNVVALAALLVLVLWRLERPGVRCASAGTRNA
jgi:Glycosyltransferase family 87